MKRFDLVYGYCGEAVMTQDDAGDWVRYDDAAAELARVTKQRDEAWEMVERAYREGRAPLAVFVPGPCDDDWNDSDAKLALDAARAESD